ncbi:DNA-directed DNA polymerase, partial [Tanacetum coccineum]
MTRSSTKELFTPFKDPEQEFRLSRKLLKALSLDEVRSPEFYLFYDLEEYSEEEVAKIMAKTMEQYMSKTRADYGSEIARPKIDDKDHFELKGQFLKELRDNTFSGSDHEDAHREGVGLRLADSHTGNHPEGGFTPFKTIRSIPAQLNILGRKSKKVKEKVYALLKFMTREVQLRELFTPFKDPEQEFRLSRKLLKALSLDEVRSPEFYLFYDLEEYSEESCKIMGKNQELYNDKTQLAYGSKFARPKIDDKDHFELKGQFLKELRDNTFSGLDLEDANKHIEKVLEIVDLFLIVKIWARSGYDEIEEYFGCKNKMGQGLAHRPVIVGVSHDLRGDSWGYVPRSLFWREDLDRDGERGFDLCLSFVEGPPQRCRASLSGFPYWTRSTETSDGLAAFQAQLNNLGREIKKVNEKVYAAQVGCEQCKGPYYTKDFPLKEEERGFGSLPSSTEANPRDHVKLISTTVEADLNLICRIRSPPYAKGLYGPQFLEAYSYGASHINNSIPQKEKDPGSFTLPCYINNVCFDNSLADLGASVSFMPLSTYLNLGLGELAHTKLIVELADMTVKYPKGIAENVLVGIGKFVFPVDFIILDMPKDVKVPLIPGRPFLSTAHAKIDVFKRKITLRTLVLNRSLDPLYDDYIKLNDLNVPLELRRDQVDDLMPTIEEGKWKIWMATEFKTWEISFLENHSAKLSVWKQK